jgi:uncharacterized repeat protein (TIGR01451 family)/fimbrial isopeptide formation D2 family protein
LIIGRALFCFPLLFLLALSLSAVSPARAAEKFCSDAPYFGLIDGDVHPVPNQITIDTDCTFQNFPESNPLTATVNFQTNDPSIYLIIFNNVTFTGHMACASVDHRIWFSNGSDYGSSNSCQDLFIPVESIDKQSPAATAAVGVPFTYTLTLPSMTDVGGPSLNDLHTVTLWDDLTATGADLTYVSLNAYFEGSKAPVTLVPEDDPGAPGGVWTPRNLSYKPIPLIPKGEQIVVEVTVVLDDTATNVTGKSFTNTAQWWFGRLIEGQFYEPLPGEWGISEPMTIAGPALVVTKTSDETALNLGTPATFTIDVQNTGGSDAWNATIVDRIPAGMCDQDPTASLGARIVEADGTPVSDLIPGVDFSVAYSGEPACRLSLAMESAAAVIAPDRRLVITYESQLDADTVADGLDLVNVAGAVEWFSADPNGVMQPGAFTRTLSDGTPTVIDHQDSQTVTTALSGYYFQKTVENLSSGANPAVTAAPGDRLRYRLRLFNVDQTIDAISISDPLDLNALDPATFAMAALPGAAAYSFNPASGLLEISGDSAPLNVAAGDEIVIEFEITLKPALANGAPVVNQASLSATGLTADSDDPYVNGIAPPGDPADPTTVVIETPGPLSKANTRASATIGERFTYRITVPADPVAAPLYDVRILDDLLAPDADMRFVSARVLSGGAWVLSNTGGSSTDLVIEDTITGIDIPAAGQAVIEMTVELLNTVANVRGLPFNNGAEYTYNRINGNDATRTSGGGSSTADMSVVEPAATAAKTAKFVAPAGKLPTDPATVGDVLEYTVTIPNGGDSTAFDTGVVDTLPANVSLVPGSATARINGVDVPGFVADPTTLPGGAIAWGRRNDDETLDIPVGQSLVLTYQVIVVSVTGDPIRNSVYVDWTSLNGDNTAERTGDGCPNVAAPDSYCYGPAAATVSTLDITSIAKSVVEDSYAETPAATADPVVRVGDTVTYELILNLQEYTTRNVVVEDTLPTGMSLESAAIEAGADFSYTLAAQPAAGATGTLRWEFGDIANAPGNDNTPTDPLSIRYVAKVVTDAPPAGVPYDTSIQRDNLAKLSYNGGDPAVYPDRLTATERVEVRQPRMGAISKVDLGAGRLGTGAAADPHQVDIAGEVMNFRLSSCNDGLAPAYGAVITDHLAPEFDESELTANPPVVHIGAATLTPGTDYTYTAPAGGGEMRIELSAPVEPGQCVTVDYDIGFRTDIAPNQTWSNQARLPEYRSLPEQGRLYASVDMAQVWMTNVARFQPLSKTLVSPAEATIGEEVVYEITVPAEPVNAALDDVVVTDTLHGALAYVEATAVDRNGNPVALTPVIVSNQVSLTIARIPAGQQAIITLRTRVDNNEQANAVSFANTASYTYAGMPEDSVTGATSGPLTVVEPLLTVAKAASTTSPAAGDVLTYSLSFTASGGGAGDDYSSAFDLSVEDSLGLGLLYVPGSAAVDGQALADPSTNGADGVSAGQTLTWSPAGGIDIDVAEGSTVTVTYQARVLDSVAPGQTLTNTVVCRWTGLDGDQAVERSGSGAPAHNDYFTQPLIRTLTTPLAVSFEKSVVNATTGEDPGANARPGDTLRYTLVLTNDSIVPVSGASVTDELAAQFAPGTLLVLGISDTGADGTNTSAEGGVNGTGIVDIRNLTLGARGEADDTLTVVFEATLAAALPNGATVLNQALVSAENLPPATSSKTSTLISSAPAFQVLKSSRDMTGDPDLLMAGDVLRYTITVKNIGDEDAAGVSLRDLVPANTAYVAGSTRLNGAPVADPPGGGSPLEDGLPVNAPEDATPGAMRADPDPATSANVATVTFEVRVNANAVDGTVVSNQGFVNGSGAGGPFDEQPSNTTRDVVGNRPLIDAQKTVRILSDVNGNGVADPGDVLRYTIRIDNFGAAAATGMRLTDAVPLDTTYEAGSATLNGDSLGAGGGVSPLVAGIPVNSDDQPAGSGIVSAGASASATFDVRIDPGVASGTAISNQGYVEAGELPTEPTDADGDPSNGNQPTLIYVGDAQELAISKEYQVVGGGPAVPGAVLEYLVRVTNIGTALAQSVVITDSLAPPLGSQVTYVPGSATLNGSAANVSFDGTSLTAAQGNLATGGTAVLRFRVRINPDQALGTLIANTAHVQWNTPVRTGSASVTTSVGGDPVQARLSGAVWHDANFNDALDGGESMLAGWTVEVYRNGLRIGSTATDANGAYAFGGLTPNEGTSDSYGVRFGAPGAGVNSAMLGMAHSPFTNGLHAIDGIVAGSGSSLRNLNLPIDPNGVVFNSITRTPVAGATMTMLHNGAPLPAGCFDDPAQQNQVTLASGYYKFDLNFSDNASCPRGGDYAIRATPPAVGYLAGPSRIIPPVTREESAAYNVQLCSDDAVAAPSGYCEAHPAGSAPGISVPSAAVRHYLYLNLNDTTVPGDSQIFNNHIPVDPELYGAAAITKTSAVLNVAKGELVPYTITATNLLGAPIHDTAIVDRFPPGFKYVQGSARLDGVPREPEIAGRELSWDGLTLEVNDKLTIRLLLIVGAGVSEGEYVNRAQLLNTATGGIIGEDTATVRVIPDPTFDCTDVIGKVFDDRNLNGYQDEGEEGLAGVRVATARGLLAATDEHGRFHITCAVVPDEDRGSNFILKLDDRTLPTGYRVTTENPRVQRATRGKMMKFNFGATIHRVVAIDIAGGAFEPETTELRLQWQPRVALLLSELKKAPSVLRLSYLGDVEREALVNRRLKTLKKEIADGWEQSEGGYPLDIETEVFWRRGGPP